MEKEIKSHADRLQQALQDLETDKKAFAAWKAEMAPEQERLTALQATLKDLPPQEQNKVLKTMGLPPLVSTASRPLTPLGGRASSQTQPHTIAAPPDIDWQFWKNMRTVKLWQACALITGLDPDSLKGHPQAWMAGPGTGPVFDSKCFPGLDAKARFDKALRLAESAVSYMNGPIFPKGPPYPGKTTEKDVSLSEVAAFFHSCEWPDMPEPMQSLAEPAALLTTPEPRETTPASVPKLARQTAPVVANSQPKPWIVIDPRDPAPEQPWYTPARYFARQLAIEKPTLLSNREILADKVSTALFNAGYKKRGNKVRFDSGTVLKAFANVILG